MPATSRRTLTTAIAAFTATALAGLLFTAGPSAYADSIRDRQWYLAYLKADQLHKITQGAGVTVAVIDSGVDGHHPDLAGNVQQGKDFIKPGTGWTDSDGHGTAIASLIAGHGHGPGHHDGILGLAPAAKILPVRTGTGAEVQGGQDRIVDAIRWAVDHGAKVINMSIRSTNLDQREAIKYALDHDVVVVAAAGNTTQHDRRVLAPARYPGVIAVSGTDQNGDFTDASVQGKEVVLAAPAVDITTASSGNQGRYMAGTGTSAATALVSAAAALVRAKYPRLNAANVIQRLVTTADDRGPKGRDPKYGYGVTDPVKALTANVAPVERNPLLPAAGTPATKPTATTNPAGSAGKTPAEPSMLIAFAIALGLAGAGITFGLIMRARRTPTPEPSPKVPQNPRATRSPDSSPDHTARGDKSVRPGAPDR